METNDLIRRAEDLAARCERTSSVTATAFLTPAERMELQNAPSLRSAAVVYSGGGTECERTCAFFLPFYLTAEELDPSEYISAVHFRSFFGEPGHRDYLGALLALGVRREWVGDIRIRGAEAWVFCLPSVVKTLAELDRAGRYTVRGEEIALADVPEEEVKTETVSFTVQSLRLDAVTAGLFHVSRTTAAELIRLGSVSLNYVPCLHTDAAIRDALHSRRHGTMFLISHRIATIRKSDLILVLDKGRVVQMGTHDTLAAQEGLYRRVCAIQNELPQAASPKGGEA